MSSKKKTSAKKKTVKRTKVIPLFGSTPTRPTTGFAQWLIDGGYDEDTAPVVEIVDSVLNMLGRTRSNFAPTAWQPVDVHTLIDSADELTDASDAAAGMISMLLAYLAFLDHTGRWSGSAEDLVHCIDDLSDYLDEDSTSAVTPDDIEFTPPSPEDEFAALVALKPVAQLRSLLSWLGTGRQITGTGVPRPALIAELAETVGVELHPREEKARSMREIPSLMALWEAATAADLIELTSTRAFRGPRAHEFDPPSIASLDAARTAVSRFVRSYFDVDDYLNPFGAVKMVAAQSILAAMTDNPPTQLEIADIDVPATTFDAVADVMLRDLLGRFEADGWLVADGTYNVPDALRPAILDTLRSLPYFDSTGYHSVPGKPPERLVVTVRLLHTEPEVWRKLELDDDLTLDMVHDVLQSAFGWEHAHLHQFRSGTSRRTAKTYISAEEGFELGPETFAEHTATIGSILARRGNTLTYEYDMGDGWEHELTLDAIVEFDPQQIGARCVDGANMAPHEDSGGPFGWADHLAAAADPQHEGHEESREWLGLRKGQSIDPTHFDLRATDAAVSRMFVQTS